MIINNENNTITMSNFQIISQPSTDKEYRHKKVYFNNIYIGYYMPNKSGLSAIQGENWNFVSKHKSITNFYTKTENDIMDEIKNQLENRVNE